MSTENLLHLSCRQFEYQCVTYVSFQITVIKDGLALCLLLDLMFPCAKLMGEKSYYGFKSERRSSVFLHRLHEFPNWIELRCLCLYLELEFSNYIWVDAPRFISRPCFGRAKFAPVALRRSGIWTFTGRPTYQITKPRQMSSFHLIGEEKILESILLSAYRTTQMVECMLQTNALTLYL